MKITNYIVFITIITLLIACEHTINKDKKVLKENVQKSEIKKELSYEEIRKQVEINIRIDSIRLSLAKIDAFKIAKTAFNEDNFSKEYEFYPDDSSDAIDIKIKIGSLFNDNQKYFLLSRRNDWEKYLDLYRIIGDKVETLIEIEHDDECSLRDTIFDVNGDGFKDFLVHWYPSSGCCIRDIYGVYLYQPNTGKFTEVYEFINPTFSPKEKIIRGVCYGHPGETELYKYKWNGETVDTIEYIYYQKNDQGEIIGVISSKNSPYGDKKNKTKLLKSVPKEYKTIEGYDWFAFGYE